MLEVSVWKIKLNVTTALMVALFYSRNMPSLEYIDHKITDAITILPQNGIPSFKADAMQTKYPAGMMILKFRIYLTECVIIINTIFSLENHAIQYKSISSNSLVHYYLDKKCKNIWNIAIYKVYLLVPMNCRQCH
jgi:hypothetical protein